MIVHSTVFKFVLLGIFAFGIGVVALNAMSYSRRHTDTDLTQKHNAYITQARNIAPALRFETDATPNRKSNLKPNRKSTRLLSGKLDLSKINIRTYKIALKDEKHENILIREAGQGSNHILLLHGKKFSSAIWNRTGTLQYLSLWGYRAVAIDIPHSGNNPLPATGNNASVQWLTKVIRALRLSNLTIISPSLSGRLTLPFMFQSNKIQKYARAFVYISPVGTSQYQASDYQQIKFPTLIVHGEKDIEFKSALENLKQIPTHQVLLIKDGSHAPYYDNPVEFHTGLRKFLDAVYRTSHKKSYRLLNKNKLFSNRTKSHTKRKQ